MLKPDEHIFRGKKWKMYWRRPRRDKEDVSKKDYPVGVVNLERDSVTISPHETPWTRFEVIMHEGIHACHPDLCELAVFDTAKDITLLFKKVGLKISFHGE